MILPIIPQILILFMQFSFGEDKYGLQVIYEN